jgi:hypothetical protein
MDTQLRRYYLTAAGIALAAVAVSLAWRDPRVTAGVASGCALGVAPFATWHLIVSYARDGSGRSRPLVILLVVGKYAVLAGAMAVLFGFRLVDGYGVGAGLVVESMAVLGAVRSGGPK